MELLNVILEVKVWYLIVSILTHVALQTFVNHFHYMRADKEHSLQLFRLTKKMDKLINEQKGGKF